MSEDVIEAVTPMASGSAPLWFDTWTDHKRATEILRAHREGRLVPVSQKRPLVSDEALHTAYTMAQAHAKNAENQLRKQNERAKNSVRERQRFERDTAAKLVGTPCHDTGVNAAGYGTTVLGYRNTERARRDAERMTAHYAAAGHFGETGEKP